MNIHANDGSDAITKEEAQLLATTYPVYNELESEEEKEIFIDLIQTIETFYNGSLELLNNKELFLGFYKNVKLGDALAVWSTPFQNEEE